MGPPDRARVQAALARLRPDGGTPIGNVMIAAKRELDLTGVTRRYLLVITEGETPTAIRAAAVDPASTEDITMGHALTAPMQGAERMEVAGVTLDIVRAESARVKRIIYSKGFRWSTHMKPIVGSDYCMHAHVGFLASGRIHIEYPDGCVQEFEAPQVVAIEPGHEGWVEGDEPAVLIEFDFAAETVSRLGMPETHKHD